MKEILEKVLTDKTVREPEDLEGLAMAGNEFLSWDIPSGA